MNKEEEMNKELLLSRLSEALREGTLGKTWSILAILYLAYIQRKGRGGMTAGDIVKVMKKLGYDLDKKEFYGLVSRWKKEGFVESIRVSGGRKTRVIYKINADKEFDVERALCERLEKSGYVVDRVDPEEVLEMIGKKGNHGHKRLF